jgi:hypothetical protein
MPAMSRLSLRIAPLFLALTIGSLSLACAAPSEEVDAEESEDAVTGGSRVDIPKSEKLLVEAMTKAEEHAARGCDTDVYKSDIVSLLRQAIAVRNTVFFRTRVIGTKTLLAQELGGTVEWQEILGTFDPKKMETLGAALARGVTLWDSNGHGQRLEFLAGAQAKVHTIDATDGFRPVTRTTTWTYRGSQITLGSGEVFDVKWTADGMLRAVRRGDESTVYVSVESECG